MNTLRTPFILLAVVVVALIGWFLWAHEQAAAPSQTQTPAVASTTTAAQTTSTASSTIQYPGEDTVASNISGVWQSTDDPNYSIDVTSNGKWTDSYQGADASSTTSERGTYELFTSANPDPDFTGVPVPGVVYVKVSEGTSAYYFSVLQSSASAMQLSYLDQDATLSFAKVQ